MCLVTFFFLQRRSARAGARAARAANAPSPAGGVLVLQGPRTRHLLLAGCLFGLLCLTRASFVVLAPVVPALIAFHGLSRLSKPGRSVVVQCAAFALGWLVMVTPWFVRNGVSVGRRSLSEEYGCAALIERFAFDELNLREYLLVSVLSPDIGSPVVRHAFGAQAMDRLYTTRSPASFT